MGLITALAIFGVAVVACGVLIVSVLSLFRDYDEDIWEDDEV